jgi:hypothetical protein
MAAHGASLDMKKIHEFEDTSHTSTFAQFLHRFFVGRVTIGAWTKGVKAVRRETSVRRAHAAGVHGWRWYIVEKSAPALILTPLLREGSSRPAAYV